MKYKKSVSSVYTENILGTNDIYMNFVVNGTEGINTLPATTTPFVVNLNGFAESIGSPLTGVQWSVISGPSGAVNTFSAPTNTVTNFVTDLFGSYVIALTATNANGQTAVDMLTLNLIEQVNQPPVAVAKWGDGTQAPKNITWQVVQPITAIWYGLYQAQLSSASSSDDGYIVGQYWQYNLNNAGWTDLTSNAPLFPSAVSPAQSINTDGNWKFRVKVKDNFGLTSNWSNDLILDITGSQMGGNPLYLFQMQILSGGSGMFNTLAQLSISFTSQIDKLLVRTDFYNVVGPSQANDFYLKVQGNGTLQYYSPQVGIERDITSIMSSNMNITIDLNNVPPTKTCSVTFIAYDFFNNVIGTQTITMGHH